MTATPALADRMGAARAAQGTGGRNIYDELERLRPQIERALPKALSADRFLRLVLTQMRTNKGLLNCSPDSLLGAVMTSAQLGLELDVRGLAYLIPRKGQVTFQIGYKGYIDLATRSGRTLDVSAQVVYSNEFFRHEEGLKPKLKHKPLLVDRGEPVAAYAVARYANGGSSFVVLPVADIERRRYRGAAADNGPWKTDWEAMAKKTAVRALSAFMPQNPEMALANAVDETVRPMPTSSEVEDIETPDDVSDVEEADVVENAGNAGEYGPPAVGVEAEGDPSSVSASPDPASEPDEEVVLPPTLESMRVDQLRAMCDELKLSNTGPKPDLIERIRSKEAPFT